MRHNGRLRINWALVVPCLLTAIYGTLFRGVAFQSMDMHEVHDSKEKLRECHARGGWPNFFWKLSQNASSEMTVAFLGGSITAKTDCWTTQLLERFQQMHPRAQWKSVNAGVGGTGALLGVCRVGHEILVHAPDLIFIEFAVNDYYVPPQVTLAMEGLIRKIRLESPSCDIGIVYTVNERSVEDFNLTSGAVPRIIHLWEDIAEHYRIPSIHLGLTIVRHHHAGHVRWRQPLETPLNETATEDPSSVFVFGTDGVHPHASTGCREYVQAIERSLAALCSAGSTSRTASSPRKLPDPLDPSNFQDVQWISPDDSSFVSTNIKRGPLPVPSAKLRPNLRNKLMRVAKKPGDIFTLHVRGSYLSVYSLVGPFSGYLVMTVDGGHAQEIRTFDTFNAFARPGFYTLYRDIAKKNHTVVVDVSPQVPDKLAIMASKPGDFPPQFLKTADFIPIAFCAA